MRLLILFAVVAAASASFPKMKYYIKNLWGCPGENGGSSSNKWKCNLELKVDSSEYVSLQKFGTPFWISEIAAGTNLYAIYIMEGSKKKYLSYSSKVYTWAVVDEKDNYMKWEILPRGNGYSIRSKYNCPSWPCNAELTSGNKDEKFVWVEAGYNQDYSIIPAE